MRIRCSIGVFAYNEQENIRQCLDSLLNQNLDKVEIVEIVVVASGCTDDTETIVKGYGPPVSLITQDRRLGKASAVNFFFKLAAENLLVLVSGDLEVDPCAVERLVSAAAAPGVGIAGARAIPAEQGKAFTRRVVQLNWEVTHRLSLKRPRLGEMVAVKRAPVRIPEHLPVDEAFLESFYSARKTRMVYVPDAIVHNRGPGSIRGYIIQSRRIARGHMQLRAEYGYTVSSLDVRLLVGSFPWKHLVDPARFLPTVGAVLLEGLGRFLGFLDYYILRKRSGLWPMTHRTRTRV